MLKFLFISSAKSLLITLVCEMGLALLLGIRKKRDFLMVFLVNVFTNLIVVAILNTIFVLRREYIVWYVILSVELWAFVTEAVIYKKSLDFKKINPFVLSLLLNCFSYFFGMILNKIF